VTEEAAAGGGDPQGAEQRYIDALYRRLAELRAHTAARLADVRLLQTRHHQALLERDAEIRLLEGALARYDVGGGALCFGRIDLDDGARYYIGRLGLSDESLEPLLVDWRAPAAEPFYRATPRQPEGVVLRRHLLCEGSRLVAIDDEVFDESALADDQRRSLRGEAALMAALQRRRTGHMADIVATIQAEQDQIIRSPLEGVLLVQGGPGTGKTAVGLHRAALLLYDHRERLERDGVLVVGPNRLFLRYIAQVLPSLGETSVVQTTLTGLGAVDVRGTDTDAVAALKGDLRMAEVIARGAWGRTVPLTEDVRIRTGFGNLTLTAAEVNRALDAALADRRTVTSTRDGFRAAVQRAAFERLVARRPEGLKLSDEVASAVRTSTDLRRILDRAWPAVTAPALVRRLLTNRAALAAAADGVLDDAEQQVLRRTAGRRADNEAWTAADLVLIDEADAVLGGRPRRFGHLVVDEAQDVSAMGWRMLGRRCARTMSMTVLGDLAQSTAPGGQSSWDDVVAVLGSPAELLYAELDVGYRVPEQILTLANGLLPHAGVDVAPTRSARVTAALPEIVATDDLAATVTAVATGLAAVHPSVAVIAPEELHPDILAAGLPAGEALATAISLVTPAEAKGLEFDAVVVVEPALIAAAGEPGVRLLYVALTRAVQHLSIVHARPLPAGLG
jgi:DNA helicase IV